MLKYTFVILFIAVYAHVVSFYVINKTTDIIAQQKAYKYLLPLQKKLNVFLIVWFNYRRVMYTVECILH